MGPLVGGERKTVLVALASNVTIAVAKAIGGLATGSSAMLAETAHSLADSFDQLLMLFSLRQAQRKPDEEHPFGYGQERFFWTFLVAVVIFLAGATFSMGDGVLRLLGHEPFSFDLIPGVGRDSFWIDYIVLGIAFVSEGTSLLRAYRQTRSAAEQAGYEIAAWVRVSKDPTTKMVFAEDSVAVLGVLVAFLGVLLNEVTGNETYDAASAVVIGALLVTVAVLLARNIHDLLIGRSARPEQRRRLEEAIGGHDAVDSVVELLTMYLGPGSLLVAARVDLRDEVEAGEIEQVAEEIEQALREADGDVYQVFLDPTPGTGATGSGSRRRREAPSPRAARG
ncbi:MAG TPA: cation diffusion facilitator family transporter [Gaiellaceae bacterium]|jgi:cation diffusion facilitator family transporter|nr:cation diffusion facilitator family transporter [Gaiellaceae bacterium]